MSRRWIRLDAQWEESEWLDGLTGQAAGCWPRLLCWVKLRGKKGRCELPSSSVLARHWRVNRQAVDELMGAAEKDGAITLDGDELVVTNWEHFQEIDRTATERKRRERKRKSRHVTRDTPVTRHATTDHQPPTETTASAIADGAGPRSEDETWGLVAQAVRVELRGSVDRSLNLAKQMLAAGVSADDLIDVCRGARKLIDRGAVTGMPPGDAVTLMQIKPTVKDGEAGGWKVGARWLWDAALEHERVGDTTPPKVRGQMQRVRAGDLGTRRAAS